MSSFAIAQEGVMNDTADTVNRHVVGAAARREYRLAWPAYLRPTIGFLFFVGVGYMLAQVFWTVGVVWMLLALGIFIVRVLERSSVRLFLDDQGVWVFSGVFPWNRGAGGVKWRDLDEAGFQPSLFSWLFKSYTVRVAHRFTKSSEIVLRHVKDGQGAAITINRVHAELIRRAAVPAAPASPEAASYAQVLS